MIGSASRRNRCPGYENIAHDAFDHVNSSVRDFENYESIVGYVRLKRLKYTVECGTLVSYRLSASLGTKSRISVLCSSLIRPQKRISVPENSHVFKIT